MTEGLLRQRRNLFICCILLWAMKFGGISLTKISLAGFELSFKNPDVITLSIWLAFAYFFYRYYQYFIADGMEKLHAEKEFLLNKYCNEKIKYLYDKYRPSQKCECNYTFSNLKSQKWIITFSEHNDWEGNLEVMGTKKINKLSLFKGGTQACMHIVFRSTVVTDYLLPFFFAFGILYYCGKNDWQGSFINFFNFS